MKSTILTLIVLLLFSLNANASQGNVFVKYGFGAKGAVVPITSVKTIDIGYHGEIGKTGLCYSVNGGYFWDNPNKHSSGYGFLQIGPRVEPTEWLYIENLFGPGFVADHEGDPLLAGHFQFSIDFGIGFKTPIFGSTIGLALKHISNAGLEKPNHGRDFIMVHVGVPI